MVEQIFYSFIKLDLVQFATFGKHFIDGGHPLDLASSFSFDYDFEDDIVCCTTTVVIEKESNPVIKAELDSYFKIQSESAQSIMENDDIILPAPLMTQFASLGFGSIRGVIYAKTMGTPLERIILPPNDIQTIFTVPVKIQRHDSTTCR